jgi:hypothetical protein
MTFNTRVLIVCTRDWFGSARLPAPLTRAGFEVGALSFPSALITRSGYVAKHFSLPFAANDAELLSAVERALLAFDPELMIPGDDPAVELLHAAAAELGKRGEAGAKLRRCLTRSLGDPAHYVSVQSRRGLHDLGRKLGLRVPEQDVVSDTQQALAFAERHGFPVILKAENTCAGYGTSICKDREALRAGFSYFEARFGGTKLPISTLTVQRFVHGRTAMRAISALSGQVLGGLSAYKLETHPAPTGPSTVVEFFENEEMERAAEAVTRVFSLSGFASFDFMIEDASGLAYLIELNPRPTPICHLGGAFGDDLCGALWEKITGSSPRTALQRAEGRRVALFPQEWIRRADSPHIERAFHDVPWQEPLLMKMLSAMGVEQMGWTHMRREESRRESLRALSER